MRLSLTLRSLCTPALFYLLISSFALIGILVQNIIQNGQFCVGYFSCPSSNLQKMIIFLIEVVYIVFWTWILTLICKSGYKKHSMVHSVVSICINVFTHGFNYT